MRRLILFALAPVAVGALLLLAISPAGASHSRRPVHTCVTAVGTHRTSASATRTERVAMTAGRCNHARTRMLLIGTHRTKTSATRVERVTLLVGPADAPRDEGECTWNEEISYKADKSEMNGRDWTDDCTGDISPASCSQTAQMDKETPGGSWILIKTGSTTYGCVEADYAWVNAPCTDSTTDNHYMNVGTFTILWDNGEVTGPKSEDSPTYTINKNCS